MSKRQDVRDRRRKEKLRSRLIAIALIVIVALMFAFVLVLPGIKTAQEASAAKTAALANIVVYPTRTISTTVNGAHLGDINAPVKVTVYADFRCSGCAYYWANLEPQIITNYVETGKVYYSFANYIVIDSYDNTDTSYRAANAALCAGEQNKFWALHDTFYANQASESADLYTDLRIEKMAENVGLDMAQFKTCYEAKKYASQVEQDIQEGMSLQITGTPSFSVNGTYVNKPFDNLVPAIEAALAGE